MPQRSLPAGAGAQDCPWVGPSLPPPPPSPPSGVGVGVGLGLPGAGVGFEGAGAAGVGISTGVTTTGTGTVTDANGQRYRLLWVNRSTVSVEFTSDEEPFVFDTHMFKIQLTPIGG